MAAKKKDNFIPSEYQKAIFDFILNGEGNLVVEAVAGSGKSTTLLEALKLIPSDKSVLFLAFNRSVRDNLAKKTKAYKNVHVYTTYGLGFMVNARNLGLGKNEMDEDRYMNEFRKNLIRYTVNSKFSMGKKWRFYDRNISDLLNFARLNLANTISDIKKVSQHYEMILFDDEINVVKKLMDWSKKNLTSYDYTDMVWYPNVLNLDLGVLAEHDFVFVDEAQDLSKAQRELILKCSNEKTRFVFVGDGRQAIYGFGAADPESFSELKKISNTHILPLSVCYRCPKTVVNLVKGIVPQIEESENAIEGEITRGKKLADVNDGDMILCRNNAPLMQIYNSFLRMGKKSFVIGKEIGMNLINLVNQHYTEALNPDLNEEGLFSSLYRFYFKKRNELAKTTGCDLEICDEMSELSNLLDKIESLKVLSEGLTTTSQLLQRLDRVFADNDSEGIRLSTVHKAKGLEFNNVFIAKEELFDPSKKTLTWEKTQEKNLEYVAYTRAMRSLSFLRNEELTNTYMIPLKDIEERLNELESPDKRHKKISSKTTISGVTTPGVNILLSETPAHLFTTDHTLMDVFGKKKKKRKTF